MTDTNNQDNAGVKVPPPLVLFGLLCAGWGINKLVPLSIGVSDAVGYVGLGSAVVSLLFIFSISRIFKKEGTEIEPWKTTRKIIDYGPYAFSRNPIYVLACGILIGLGLFFDSYWGVFSIIPFLIIVFFTAVQKEEYYLEKKFGQEYLDYKSKVRRWL